MSYPPGPGYPGANPYWAQPPRSDPGTGLALGGLITAGVGGLIGIGLFFLPLPAGVVGLVLGLVARGKSRRAGFSNGLALASIIVGAVVTAFGVVLIIVLIAYTLTLSRR